MTIEKRAGDKPDMIRIITTALSAISLVWALLHPCHDARPRSDMCAVCIPKCISPATCNEKIGKCEGQGASVVDFMTTDSISAGKPSSPRDYYRLDTSGP